MNRREFLRDAATTTLSLAMVAGAVELRAEDAPKAKKTVDVMDAKPTGPPVNCAVIGINLQGREILTSLAKLSTKKALKYANITAICDSFSTPAFVKKSAAVAPTATFYEDYKKVLDQKDIQAVFIATPSHKHKQIALDALAAGKHVYCEAPLATDLEEARDIARAGLAAKTIFQPGLQVRSNMQHQHVLEFIRASNIGRVAAGRAQWHSRESWKRLSPTDDRMKELNWRLSKATSTGLVGEVGIHQIDTATWFLNALPVAVTGYGGIMSWNDGRDIPDTVQCVIEYPGSINYVYDATLSASYEGAYEMFFGSAASIQMRDQRAWMFKESDANDIGWEQFARKDPLIIGDPKAGTGFPIGVGIALVADASKQLALGKQPKDVGTDVSKTALYQAIDDFLYAIQTNGKPTVGPLEGFQATVIAHKCNDAVVSGSKITFEKEWFTL
jgi:predicted dehydrogenase